jgi:hypothetical protein
MPHDSGLPLCTMLLIYFSGPPDFALATLLLLPVLGTISHTPVCIICYLCFERRDSYHHVPVSVVITHAPCIGVAPTLGGLSEMGLRHEQTFFCWSAINNGCSAFGPNLTLHLTSSLTSRQVA